MAQEDLRRSYRRLMWAYPRWYRRERGAELLTTLLDDAAAAGRRRATYAETRDLIAGGLRTRLRPPRGPLAGVVAGLVALYVAVVAAAFGVLCSGYPGPPADDESVAAARIAVSEPPRNLHGPPAACDILCPEPVAGDDVTAYRRPWDHTDSVRIDYHLSPDRTSTVVTEARRRLIAAGWRVTGLDVAGAGASSFEASNGRLDLWVSGAVREPGSGAPVTVVVAKSRSARAIGFAIAGFAGGLLAGWLIAAWTLQRWRLHRDKRRWAVAGVAAPFLLSGPWLGIAALWFATVAVAFGRADAKSVKAPLAVLPDLSTPYWIGPALIALSAVAAVGLAALPGPGREPGRRARMTQLAR